ncbi:hypothetical protein THAOC_31818 [Thalassiosira oceanica]|uniref:Uncharacterized protein n=2 Tax=Thalassiosira oceanica TaxID=159749 RepID=K0RAJ2_THAOC|nr:hypothetical protein THAOC_31818 [Thalassiosira oceanica]|eukprot:EJK49319.1 hypothetical protein THAOC_31818 [Thalassiosira oceanica]
MAIVTAKSVALLGAVACSTTLAATADSTNISVATTTTTASTDSAAAPELDDAIWEGSLPWTLYGAGGCQDKDETAISATGVTSALYKLEDGAVCETDSIDTNVTDVRVLLHTKILPVSCGEVTMEVILYNCDDPECASCDDAAEADATLPSAAFKEAYNDVDACFSWEPVADTNISVGGITNITAQAFDDSSDLRDTQDYWSAIMTNTCGEDWFESVLSAPDQATNEAPETTVSTTSEATTSGEVEAWLGPLNFTAYSAADYCVNDIFINESGEVVGDAGYAKSLTDMGDYSCEVDIGVLNGTEYELYTKIKAAECSDESLVMNFFLCKDESCSTCSDAIEAIQTIPVDFVKEPANGVCLESAYPNSTTAFAEKFDNSNDVNKTQSYFTALANNMCGADWLQNLQTGFPTSVPEEADGGVEGAPSTAFVSGVVCAAAASIGIALVLI